MKNDRSGVFLLIPQLGPRMEAREVNIHYYVHIITYTFFIFFTYTPIDRAFQ